MEENKNSSSLPDISGVFHIDEKNIPTEMIAPDEESRTRTHEPIMLSDPVQEKLNKAELKKRKAQKKAEKRAEKRKKAKKRFILVLVFLFVVAAAVFGIKFAVENSRRPTGEIFRSYTGSISEHYDTKALLTTAVVGKGSVKTVAVFSENNYDIYSISKGLSAEITLSDGSTIGGRITDVSKENSDSPMIEKLKTVFPDGEYSAGVNYLITAETDTDKSLTEDTVADIRVITSIADGTVLVPSTAVHKDGAKYYVWTYKPLTKTAEKQEVSVGIEADGVSEITKGLKTDVRVVSTFDCEDDQLSESMKIKVKK